MGVDSLVLILSGVICQGLNQKKGVRVGSHTLGLAISLGHYWRNFQENLIAPFRM